jgi:hypothetical protein
LTAAFGRISIEVALPYDVTQDHMPTEPNQAPPDLSDTQLHEQLAKELAQLQTKLADIDARGRAQLESERKERADRTAAREPDAPGIPE